MKREITWSNWRKFFEADLAAAAAKCGCDVSALKMADTLTDRTWGDRYALVFYGADDATCHRAAEFFVKWGSRNLNPLRSYDSQVHVAMHTNGRNEPIAMEFMRFDNGAEGWHAAGAVAAREALPEEPETEIVPGVMWRRPKLVETRRAPFAVNYLYIPCAD